MRRFLLEDLRLVHYYIIFFGIYILILQFTPIVKFETGALAMFTANSFLYGFYVAPILSGQRARVEDLHRIVRAESNAVYGMVLDTKKLPDELRNRLQDMYTAYLRSCIRQRTSAEGESHYEKLISFCLTYKGDHREAVDKLLQKLIANQINRTNFAMQMTNRVFANEWVVMIILFGITESFILTIRMGQGFQYRLLAALLCTALSMLIVILVKLSTLTHKKAREIWNPYRKLLTSNFYRID